MPFGDLVTTLAKRAAIASDKLFPEAVATADNFSAVSSLSPTISAESEATSSSFWASESSARSLAQTEGDQHFPISPLPPSAFGLVRAGCACRNLQSDRLDQHAI